VTRDAEYNPGMLTYPRLELLGDSAVRHIHCLSILSAPAKLHRERGAVVDFGVEIIQEVCKCIVSASWGGIR
jgi:hypothetical protein